MLRHIFKQPGQTVAIQFLTDIKITDNGFVAAYLNRLGFVQERFMKIAPVRLSGCCCKHQAVVEKVGRPLRHIGPVPS